MLASTYSASYFSKACQVCIASMTRALWIFLLMLGSSANYDQGTLGFSPHARVLGQYVRILAEEVLKLIEGLIVAHDSSGITTAAG